ncbi:DEAD/DEAH box helicase [Succinimonas sp.]|uniref:DEAD/DEAH box helicase n=1 Tax=Succinimonas sp. TaxID=1936151 RepID=UPI00386DD55A
MLPSILAKQLKKGIGDYIETMFPMTNAPFKGSLRNMIDTKDAIYHEPFVSVRLPFRVADEMPTCFEAIHPDYLPYVHQQTAFSRLTGDDGRSTLIATGTGSGKTECFLYPILEYCYRHRGERGIKALIIYPMNALATDQAKRIAEIIHNSPELRGNVSAGMYVGGRGRTQERMMGEDMIITDHDTMLNNPPDILMTNYKMLDYLLIRPKDAALWKDNRPDTLKYIAVDELHTFDGAQGTDLACLLRRLKSRLYTSAGYLCCIGTSATMGSRDNGRNILEYAEEVFGEPFEDDAVVTEERLSPMEFFAGYEVTDFTVPSREQISILNEFTNQDDEESYLRKAAAVWTSLEDVDVLTPEGRLALGSHLMHHSFMQAMITVMQGHYYQAATIVKELTAHYPALKKIDDAEAAINAMLALISHARTGSPDKLRPFLNVQVQFWIRELRRLLAKVSGKEISYSIAHDLNAQQVKHYLPVVNCRDCGATGWTSAPNEQGNAAISNLETFYNLFFRGDTKISMMFPHEHKGIPHNMIPGRLCPECLSRKLGADTSRVCDNCGSDMIDIVLPQQNPTSGSQDNKQYVCPFCESKRGLSLMGLRSATEISTELSQVFASKFNDDKKTLAFSDNVQDAAHRAGFFNAHTWRFGIRTAIQQYVINGGAGLSLEEFIRGFISYWHGNLDDEDFVSYFIAPNMTWMRAYEQMVEKRRLGRDDLAKKLLSDIEKRISYEILLEYGLSSRFGRSLERTGCSCLALPSAAIIETAHIVRERVINEIGGFSDLAEGHCQQMVAGYLKIMIQNGAFKDDAFSLFLKERGNTYLLSNDRVSWMPGRKSGRNTPRFIHRPAEHARKNINFDTVATKKYLDWIASCSHETRIEPAVLTAISTIILEELVKSGIVVSIPAAADYTVYAINKAMVSVAHEVVILRCNTCGITHAVAAMNKEFWTGAPCIRHVCSGILAEDKRAGLNYYGKLYSSGDIARINAREHTGLLERDDREDLEMNFKRKKKDSKLWDPNVLSCTPTLEMGIDIGDLSTVILCSMPPAQSQFLQRTGRAGRKDGNALTLVVAAAKPHDLYFYADPLDMMEGNVMPPKIFLRASAVLERQFVAYCMDSWVKRGVAENDIPDHVSTVLSKLDSHPADVFPFNFLNYVQNNLSHLLNSFIQMFGASLDKEAKDELRIFAQGGKLSESPMHLHLLESFRALKKHKDSLTQSMKQLNAMIKELEDKPKDSSYEEDIKEIKAEKIALGNVVKEINNKNVFNFLSDDGLLPNYAFPESGIVLKAILYRKEDESEQDSAKKKFQKTAYEYNRAAASALSEFAPNNSFYADGRKLVIDQVDLTSAQFAKWRLCPICSHAQLEEAGKDTACCPRCGSPAWADSGQVRNMLKVQMVYSNMDYVKSLIDDASDDRSKVFYCKQLLVDVDDEHDIAKAYEMNNDEFSFGYEFVKNAVLREINFGEKDLNGENLAVAGVADVRKGFKICKYCGKILPEKPSARDHTFYCKTRKMTCLENDPYEECLFLYREFATEVLRILIPATTMDASEVRKESFIAAFMLGMKEYFGNVDHLRAVISEIPVPDADYRKQYLVIYDSVPGGTGYLKQLMNKKGSLIDIFEKALHKLEQCSCKEDPQKDGCYHCLYAYRQSMNIGSISRSTAIRLLKTILSGKEHHAEIKKLADIPVNSLFDSELERRFVEAIAQAGNEDRIIKISNSLVNGKEGYVLRINDSSWEIEPQVSLGPTEGVAVQCKPDFVIYPLGKSDKLPVAIFTDGFIYHKDRMADDTLKRMAICRSGRFRLWALSWRDVQSVFKSQGDYATPTLAAEKMPNGPKMYKPTITAGNADALRPGQMSSFELLLRYLEMEDSERLFEVQAQAYSLSLLNPSIIASKLDFADWHNEMEKANAQVHFSDEDYVQPGTFFGTWIPRSSEAHFCAYAGILAETIKADRSMPAAVLAVLDDRTDSLTDKYEQEWNGFWKFFNIMQFNKRFAAVSRVGLETHVYAKLPNVQIPAVAEDLAPAGSSGEGWTEVRELLFDDDLVKLADELKNRNIAAPEAGYELANEHGAVVAEIELAWVSRRIGYMTEDQLIDRKNAENRGWVIAATRDELLAYFGEM